MSRPIDWAPLAESDPLAGSPQEIEKQAALFRTMAAEMDWQVRTLKGIGTDTALQGDYAVALQGSAKDVAAKLEKVIHRYTEAARCLSAWAPELEGFQRKTEALLIEAQNIEMAAGRDIHSDLFTPGVPAYQQFHSTALGDAPAGLAPLSRQLQAVLEEAEERGRYWAHQIGQAIDDQLTDGFWDHVHKLVHQAKHAFGELTENLGYVTTAVALLGLWVPGVDVAVLGLMLATTAIDAKKASEGGSWFDVGLDAVGLVSFGVGTSVGRGLKTTMEATRAEAAAADGVKAAAATREAVMNDLHSLDPLKRKAAVNALKNLGEAEGNAAEKATRDVLDAPIAEAKFRQVLFAGSEENVKLANTTKQLLAEHPGNEAVRAAAKDLRRQVLTGQANYLGATALDFGDKGAKLAAEHTPWSWAHSYRDFQERFTLSEGTLDEPVPAR